MIEYGLLKYDMYNMYDIYDIYDEKLIITTAALRVIDRLAVHSAMMQSKLNRSVEKCLESSAFNP